MAASSCGVAARPTHRLGSGSTLEQGEGVDVGSDVESDAAGDGVADGLVAEASGVRLDVT
jgi:hypothetical protein